MQCGICKTFHVEMTGPCSEGQSHRIHQLAVDGCNYPAALRHSAQRLRIKAEEMEREASALESKMADANASAENVAPSRPEGSSTSEVVQGEPTRRSA